MIPAHFDYARAASVQEAVDALTERGKEAKLIAGGQTLLPLMKLRAVEPSLLIDVGGIAELHGVREMGTYLSIGAAVTHHEILGDPLVAEHCPIVAHAAASIGDPQVRHRGTIGGALAQGDAAGDLPAVALALDATFVTHGPAGQQLISAGDFFQGHLQTALGSHLLLTSLRFPKLGPDWGCHYATFTRVARAQSVVGVCAIVRHGNGTIHEARVGLTNMGSVPLRAAATEQALMGAPCENIPDAAMRAADATSPPADLNAQPDYRRHLARVLTRRALEAAVT